MELQRTGEATANQISVTVATDGERDWSSQVRQRLDKKPTLLKVSAGSDSCCIFKVPETFVKINPNAYKPHFVSIGPYHHGRECVRMIEEHKPRFFSALLARTSSSRFDLDQYFNAVANMERKIRGCYSEPLDIGSSELIEMMVFDGCFVIEVFRVIQGIITRKRNDPIFNMVWLFTAFMRDFLQLENQVPFFVLQKLYDMSRLPTEVPQYSLVELTLRFFNHAMQRSPEVLEKHYDNVSRAKHLLHLIQLSFVDHLPKAPREPNRKYLQLVHSVAKLRRAGITFKPRKGHEWLDIQFKDGVLEIPPLKIDDFTTPLFLNFVAFEQCYSLRSRHVTTYMIFIGWLMTSADDVSFLSDHHVIENQYGTDAEVASFLNNVMKEVAFDIKKSYLATEIAKLNRHYSSQWRVWWTEPRSKYFGTPWSCISAVAALLLLIFSFIQSFFSIYWRLHPPHGSGDP